MGDGVAGRSKAKEMLVHDLIGDGFGMQCTATAKHRATVRRDGTVLPGGAMEWLGEPTRCVAMAKR